MMKKTKKRNMVLKCSMLVLAMIAGVWAYYNSTTTLKNKMKASEYGNETEEKFTPNLDWQPGEEVVKETNVRNTGDYDLFVRIKMSATWSRTGTGFISHDSTTAEFHSASASTSDPPDQTDGDTIDDSSVVFQTISVSPDWVFTAGYG